MTVALAPLMDALKAAADRAGAAETAFRRETAQRIATLERERIFAFRRLNVMRTVIAAVAAVETEEDAIARGSATLCGEVGWDGISDARTAVLEQFAAVTKAIFADLHPISGELSPDEGSALTALAAFEAWYVTTHPVPFWALFDQYVPQTSIVDF
jgi:hypothetical protein